MQANGENFQARKRVLKMIQTRKTIDAQSVEVEILIEKMKRLFNEKNKRIKKT